MGKLIFIWALASLHHLLLWGCWEPSDLSDSDDINEEFNTKLLSLSNPWSGDGSGDWDGRSPWSLLCLLWCQPLRGQRGNSLWSELVTPGVSFWEESPHWSNLNGCRVDRFMCGCPGTLTFTWHLIRAWAISCQPSWIVKGSAAR